MMNLTTTQFALLGFAPARRPVETQTVQAVPGAGAADTTRGDGPEDRTAEAERAAREVRTTGIDPEAPTGPPPAFEANVLEAERAKLRQGQLEEARRIDKSNSSKDAGDLDGDPTLDDGTEPSAAGRPPEHNYEYQIGGQNSRKLDLSR